MVAPLESVESVDDVERRVQSQNVLFDLDLAACVLAEDVVLGNHFDRHEVFGSPLTRQKYFSVAALTELL